MRIGDGISSAGEVGGVDKVDDCEGEGGNDIPVGV